MIEKVNPDHPDKLADRIAGALVDYAYEEQEAPRVAFEVLLGHGEVNIIGESSVYVPRRVANYVRIQQGHSVLLHIALAFLTCCISLIFTIYYAISPNHYFHL